jgi:hypothetical protein
MKALFYGMITLCGFFMAYAFAEAPSIRMEAIGMTAGILLMYVGAVGLRMIGGDDDD